MSHPKHKGVPPFSSPSLLAAKILLALAGTTAAYLAWHSISGGSLAGCGPGSDCDKVLQSRWSQWLGIPVSLPALAIYGLLFASITGWQKSRTETSQRSWARLATASAAIILSAVIWFVGLQLFVIHALCRFCLVAHIAAFLAALIVLRLCLRQITRADQAGLKVNHPKIAFGQGLILAALAVVALAAGQHLYAPPRFQVQSLAQTNLTSTIPASATNAAPAAPTATAPPPSPVAQTPSNPSASPAPTLPPNAPAQTSPSTRIHSIHNGQFSLRVDEVPLIGSATAPHLIVSLFDYTCHYCRDLHNLLLQLQQQFKDQLAIINLPMPLDASCNPVIRQTAASHVNACEYARLGLAVWRANREKSHDFDAFVFAPSSPPALSETQQYAEQLVGRDKLTEALADPWIIKQLQTSVSIFQVNSQIARAGRMPQLIIGHSVVTGPVDQIHDLYRVVGDQFGLKPPQP